jgi:hypothetical protein
MTPISSDVSGKEVVVKDPIPPKEPVKLTEREEKRVKAIEQAAKRDRAAGGDAIALAELDPPPDPSTIGYYTGLPKEPVTIGGMTGEMEQVVALQSGFAAVKNEYGDEVKAHNNDLIIYFKDPTITATDVWLVQVISYKFAVAIGAVPAPAALSEAEQQHTAPEALRDYRALEVADFTDLRFTDASRGNVFTPSTPPAPPETPLSSMAKKPVSAGPPTTPPKSRISE